MEGTSGELIEINTRRHRAAPVVLAIPRHPVCPRRLPSIDQLVSPRRHGCRFFIGETGEDCQDVFSRLLLRLAAKREASSILCHHTPF